MKASRIILGLLLSVASVANVWAKGAGSSACSTLTKPVSAKVAGMGGAYTAVSGDVVCMHYNPAGLVTLTGFEIATMYQKGFAGDNYANLLFGKKTGFTSYGLSVQYYDTGKIEMYDFLGNEINKVGQCDIIVTIGAGMPLMDGKLNTGMNIKGISSEIFGVKAAAMALDAGMQYLDIVRNTDIGFAVQNMGSKLTYVSEGDNLPLIVRVGAAYENGTEKSRIGINIDVPYYLNEEEMIGSAGVEYVYDSLIAVRGGYKMKSSGGDEQGISAGVGFIWSALSVDYAIGFTDKLDNPHHVSLNMKF